MSAEYTKNRIRKNWDKHSNPRAGKQTGQQRNDNRENKDRKHKHPINPNKKNYYE